MMIFLALPRFRLLRRDLAPVSHDTIPRAEFDAALAEMGSRPELVARLIEKANRE